MENIAKINELMERTGFPENAQTTFRGLQARLEKIPEYGAEFDRILGNYLADPKQFGDTLDLLGPLASKYGDSIFTLHMMLSLHCGVHLHELYRERGYSDEIYWRGMLDLRCKLVECMKCKNVPGTFVGGWFGGWFEMTRFALGRFQYEYGGVFKDPDRRLYCGYTIHYDDRFVGFHIPSTGEPLTDEAREASYKMAYEFYKDTFHGGPVVLRTSSWLLYPKHYEFLPKNSNILRFMNDFELDNWHEEKDSFHNAWRVFDGYADLPVEEWPEDTSLRRAYKKWLLDGNYAGSGAGLIIMDKGKNVTHIKDYFA